MANKGPPDLGPASKVVATSSFIFKPQNNRTPINDAIVRWVEAGGDKLFDGRVGVALAHVFAAMTAGEMHAVAFGGRDETADLFEALWRKPALAPAALHGKAIGGFFVRPAKLVAAFVGKDPLLNGCRNLVEQARVHNEEAWIRRTIVVELVVNDGRSLPAQLFAIVEFEFARR